MKLSIITINLNNKVGLEKTITSVISQSFYNFEWIIIDGGSTDGSKELIEQNAEHFVYWVSESDDGVYNAMNKGIRKSTGDYILFLNSGDWLYNNNVLKDVFDTNPTEDIVYCDDGGQTGIIENEGSPTSLTIDFLYTQTICHQTIFHKRILFENELYDEKYRIVSDWKFLYKQVVFRNASYRKINILLCVLQGNSSFDAEKTTQERQLVLNEFYSPMERDFIEKNIAHTSPFYNETKYIESRKTLKKIIHWFVKIHYLFCTKCTR